MYTRRFIQCINNDSPQDFVPAVTAAVPLTAVQVADADLLKSKKRSSRRHCDEGTLTANFNLSP